MKDTKYKKRELQKLPDIEIFLWTFSLFPFTVKFVFQRSSLKFYREV